MNVEDMPGLSRALQQLSVLLQDLSTPWLLGGSCSLLLQGVQLDKPPRDLDVYSDLEGIQALHEQLAAYALSQPRLDQEGMYKSVLSRYELDSIEAELVGGFEVCSGGSLYTVEMELLYPAAPDVLLHGTSVRLTPLSHELLFNVLRDREDRYQAIGQAIRYRPDQHHALLQDMLSRYTLNSEHTLRIQELAGIHKG
ncbi:hypothetical protein E6C60_1836 [Paenibacillus algicola]|uniref:Uncharacterized protein n=1 Tax=Paenibacillus algicola TaxID=2565926 RepID=A0A4P8XM26_9BACL|nr:hypothetical protein [Paenibacillus algicola]QCT02551.1 hypothetical protein E6C60_1836 [Paenibacillus algicola]